MKDDRSEPVLGRVRARTSTEGQRYLARVLAASALAGVRKTGRFRFDGSRIGRGAAIGRVLAGTTSYSGLRTRRAVIRVRIVRLDRTGPGAARAHLRYILRDGVQRDGSPGIAYSSAQDDADGKAFLGRCNGDRHHFRLILSAEDGDAYDDLRPLVRRFAAQMEQDLATRLEWLAVDHADTGHPHTHMILKGRDDRGQDLIIAREYISFGMRERLAELLTFDLGPRQDFEIASRLRREMDAERVTIADQRLESEAGLGRTIIARDPDPVWHAALNGRLKKLATMGLAEDLKDGHWKLADDLTTTLRDLSERGEIIRTMHRAMKAAGIERLPAEILLHRDEIPAEGIVGRVVGYGLHAKQEGRHYVIIDGIDGRAHHVPFVDAEAIDALPPNGIVRLTTGRRFPRTTVDETEHAHDSRALESHLNDALAGERTAAGRTQVEIEVLSPQPLSALPQREAATWLDRRLAAGQNEPVRASGFGAELIKAISARREWLVGEGWAEEAVSGLRFKPGALAALRQRELAAAAAGLSRELGLAYVAAEEADHISGTLLRRIDLASGRVALIDTGRDFTLVPWRPMFERCIGKDVAGIARSDGISWSFERARSIER